LILLQTNVVLIYCCTYNARDAKAAV